MKIGFEEFEKKAKIKLKFRFASAGTLLVKKMKVSINEPTTNQKDR